MGALFWVCVWALVCRGRFDSTLGFPGEGPPATFDEDSWDFDAAIGMAELEAHTAGLLPHASADIDGEPGWPEHTHTHPTHPPPSPCGLGRRAWW